MAVAILAHAFLFLAFWLTNLPYQNSLNAFLVSSTGVRANFLFVFIAFAGLVGLWSAARLAAARRAARRAGPAWPYLFTGILFLIFFYASFTFLFLKNSAQFYRLGQMFQYFRLFVDAAALLLLARALPRWVKGRNGTKKALASAGLLVLWLVPVFFPPGNIYRGALPEKPRLIAHRGVSTRSPENTLAALRAAAALGVYGLETDISASADGVLFLMHDLTPARTTNAAAVFPGRENTPAETFRWDELALLTTGGGLDGAALTPGEPVPTLKAALQVVKENNLVFIYDLRIPAAGHAYAAQALDLCLGEIRAAGVASRTWVLAKPEEAPHIRAALPDAILAAGIGYYEKPPSPGDLAAGGYQVVNSVVSLPVRMIHAYQAAGLWVNLWLVDEPWQYSRLWLAGANSVTSNYVQSFAALSRPVAAIPYPLYLAVWGMVGLLAGGVVLPFRWRLPV